MLDCDDSTKSSWGRFDELVSATIYREKGTIKRQLQVCKNWLVWPGSLSHWQMSYFEKCL
jgi:hypothetical protein